MSDIYDQSAIIIHFLFARFMQWIKEDNIVIYHLLRNNFMQKWKDVNAKPFTRITVFVIVLY